MPIRLSSLLVFFLLAFGLPASAVVGTRAPGPGSSFGGAKIAPLSRSWNDAFGFVLPSRAPAPGYGKFSFLLGSGVYYPERAAVYEPLAWALSQKHEPLSFVQLAPEAQEAALQEAAELASQELTAQAHAALAAFSDEKTDAKTLAETVRATTALKLLWSGYLPKDLAPPFERAYLAAREKVQKAQADRVGAGLEKLAAELQGPETVSDAGLTGPIAELLVERLLLARDGASESIAQEIQRAARHFDDPAARRTLALGLLSAMKTWKDDHSRAMHAADALKRMALGGVIPQDLHEPLISGILSLEYPSDLILRLEALRVVNNIGEKTRDEKARAAAYKAVVRESLGPNMRRDQDFDYSILMMKQGGTYTTGWDERMGGLPHQEVVDEYRRRWFSAARNVAQKKPTSREDLERLRSLEKKYPALLLNLQIPLNPPAQEKSAAGLKTDKTPDLPEPNLN